jgi:hypothetical protein
VGLSGGCDLTPRDRSSCDPSERFGPSGLLIQGMLPQTDDSSAHPDRDSARPDAAGPRGARRPARRRPPPLPRRCCHGCCQKRGAPGIRYGRIAGDARRGGRSCNASAVSRPGELHPRPLSERCVNLSTHTAPVKQTPRPSLSASVRKDAAPSSRYGRGGKQPASYEL